MVTRKPGLSESELFRRAQEPTEQAEQRRRDAKQFLKTLQSRDDEVSARMAKLKAARLAAEASGTLPSAPAAPAKAAKPKTAKPATAASKSPAKKPAARKAAGKTEPANA
jgi:hypothetical protein